MGRIDRDKNGNLAVAIENEADAAQLRATIKASDGADEIPVQAGKAVTFSSENPFNFIALWATDFAWSPEAMKAALDCLVPVAQTSVHLHRRSQNKLMRRMTQEMTGGMPKRPDEPKR
jgi:hypothetical protein